ncbi:MAG TPA: 1,4-dihydroxy-6-naphthoate synthase [Bacteroidales bacterium]|nr:1,4-dihydroxy-6-naphthoate synthase [Bacteroidales bacterium]HPS18328.1 1,4-dihydroxy-6-naphthoate synthase [Bacteroidales bacterium]
MNFLKSKIVSTGGGHEPEISIGFSPCPNDTFIFDALVNGKIDTEGLQFNYVLNDVEELNRKALIAELDVTKISFFAYSEIYKNYQLLDSGSALGFSCGPLLVAREKFLIDDINKKKIAIPGIHTTANFLMTFSFPDAKDKTEILFSEIEDVVMNGTFDAGVIIHENRFTYQQKGLHKIVDLGELWEQKTKMPIPLGGIAVKRSLDDEFKKKIEKLIRKSVEFAFQNPASSNDFVCRNAQAMDVEVMKKHIELYVNEFSVSLGNKGKEAIKFLFNKAKELKIILKEPGDIFI